eukprot:31497-Pelagococcus_subviridis.AAC.19
MHGEFNENNDASARARGLGRATVQVVRYYISPPLTRLVASFSSEQHAAQLLRALLLERLEVLIDYRHREKDPGTAADRPHEVRDDGEETDAHPAERGCGGDVPVQLALKRGLAVADHEHLLLLQLLRDVARGRAGDFDPRLREERARAEHEREVKQRVQRVRRDVAQGRRRGDVVHEPADGDELPGGLALLPPPQELHEEIPSEALEQELGDEVKVRHERGLQDDRHVARVEQLDRVRLLQSSRVALGPHGEVHAEALEVDHHEEDQNRREEVRDVRQVRAVKRLLQRPELVFPRDDEVEQRDHRAFELRAAAGVDRRRGERFPDDGLALVRRDEQRDAASEAVSFRQHLVEADDDHARHEELQDDEDRVPRAEVADVAVDPGDDVRDGLADRDQHAEELLRAVTVERCRRESVSDGTGKNKGGRRQ